MMNVNLEKNANNWLHLYADCIPVKGASRSAICDLTRNELVFFPSEYFEVLEFLTSDKIGNLLNSIECEEEKKLVVEFIDFLDQNEFITFLSDPSLFPSLEERWDAPAVIQNAVIDVDTVDHDFDKIFFELDALGCQFVQVRCFSDLLKLEDVYRILSSARHKSIQSVELMLKYDASVSDEAYKELVKSQPILARLTIHSSPEERLLTTDFGCDEERSRYIKKQVYFTTQVIDSQIHCGIINITSLNAPSVDNFFEAKLYNGCLNRKVSIDAFGEIKNCPSMRESYGNIKDTGLDVAISIAGFKDKWKITKDQVDVCRDCEFRYVCSDCRAFVENPGDLYSKPLKCGYDPYTGEWEEWSQNPLKQHAIGYYGMKETVAKEPAVI